MNDKLDNGEIQPLDEWHRRFPNEYILYEGLNYTEAAEITQSRLIAHAPEKEQLIALQESFLDKHPDACVGIEWTGPIVPEGWILML